MVSPNKCIVWTMIICGVNVQHNMAKQYNHWGKYVTHFITIFTTYRCTALTTRGLTWNIAEHYSLFLYFYPNKLVMHLAYGSDGSASTGDAARQHRARACRAHKYNKLSCRRGSPLSLSTLPLQMWLVNHSRSVQRFLYVSWKHRGPSRQPWSA